MSINTLKQCLLEQAAADVCSFVNDNSVVKIDKRDIVKILDSHFGFIISIADEVAVDEEDTIR